MCIRDRAKRVVVKVGRQAGGAVKLDSGLVGGEQVIVEGQNKLSDGARVELRSDAPRPASANGGRGRGGRGGTTGSRGGN